MVSRWSRYYRVHVPVWNDGSSGQNVFSARFPKTVLVRWLGEVRGACPLMETSLVIIVPWDFDVVTSVHCTDLCMWLMRDLWKPSVLYRVFFLRLTSHPPVYCSSSHPSSPKWPQRQIHATLTMSSLHRPLLSRHLTNVSTSVLACLCESSHYSLCVWEND